MNHYTRLLCAGLGLSLMSGVALADPPPGKGHGHGHNKGQEDSSSSDSSSGLVYANVDFGALRQTALSQHCTGYASLPPGIRKNLARGKPLPPGIAKKFSPNCLGNQLPQYPGYQWEAIGTDLVLIQQATQIVAQVVNDIFQ